MSEKNIRPTDDVIKEKLSYTRVFSPKAGLLPQTSASIYWQGGLPDQRRKIVADILTEPWKYIRKSEKELLPLPSINLDQEPLLMKPLFALYLNQGLVREAYVGKALELEGSTFEFLLKGENNLYTSLAVMPYDRDSHTGKRRTFMRISFGPYGNSTHAQSWCGETSMFTSADGQYTFFETHGENGVAVLLRVSRVDATYTSISHNSRNRKEWNSLKRVLTKGNK